MHKAVQFPTGRQLTMKGGRGVKKSCWCMQGFGSKKSETDGGLFIVNFKNTVFED